LKMVDFFFFPWKGFVHEAKGPRQELQDRGVQGEELEERLEEEKLPLMGES